MTSWVDDAGANYFHYQTVCMLDDAPGGGRGGGRRNHPIDTPYSIPDTDVGGIGASGTQPANNGQTGTIRALTLGECADMGANSMSLAARSRIQGDNLLGRIGLDVLGNQITQAREIWFTLTRKETGGAEAYTVIGSNVLSNRAQNEILTRAFTDYSKEAFGVGRKIGSQAAKAAGTVKTAYDTLIYIYSFGECSIRRLGWGD
ncbi:MAG TPA: hypothetical protein VN622_06960 [Clostridia bacterium]|nr:hypothetical protein [Clostridia bacterium]